ncbi:MAG: FtsX-like permease family protein [Nitrospiraceae bacterium]|nr:FtsX-like permease family protein [Nitrospiraceae bacterium]
MTIGRLIRREMQGAKANTVLCFTTVVIATALLVAMVGISRASVDATRISMKRMGFNLLILPSGTDPARFQALDFQDKTMPEEYVTRLATQGTILAQHFVAKYQKTIQVDGCTMVLTGVLSETIKHDTKKKPMDTAYEVPEGKVFVGSAAAKATGVQVGDTLTVLGEPFEVARILDEVGIIPDDIRLYAYLHDVQRLVGAPGRINAIDALACYCPVAVDDVLAALKNSINEVLPDTEVQPYKSILLARQSQRAMMYRLELAVLAIVMAGSAAAIWGLTYQNVRNRRYEIGVLRALGVPDRRIAMLFVGKTLAYSIAGAALGCLCGYYAAVQFNVAERPISVPGNVWLAVLVATPLMTALFALPPLVSRLAQDPLDVLGGAE